jgi:endonuclease III
VTSPETPHCLAEIMDPAVAAMSASRGDALGQMMNRVLSAEAPDELFQFYAKQLLNNYSFPTRKQMITTLAATLGAERQRLKEYLRAYGLCGPAD